MKVIQIIDELMLEHSLFDGRSGRPLTQNTKYINVLQ